MNGAHLSLLAVAGLAVAGFTGASLVPRVRPVLPAWWELAALRANARRIPVKRRGSRAEGLQSNPSWPRSWNDLSLHRGVLQTPDGPIQLKILGRGTFATAYTEVAPKTQRPRVLVFTGDDVYDKEILATTHEELGDNPHLPAVEKLGETRDQSVYVMPLYESPFRKAMDPAGWQDYVKLKKCRDDNYRFTFGGRGGNNTGHRVNQDVLDCAERVRVRPQVLDALRALADTAMNYSSAYVFEFSPRNLAGDGRGNLILLDVLYDQEKLIEVNRERGQARARRELDRAQMARYRW